ncbi:MAG: HipA N-terminal domain-containing protein [Bacteroidales bacterium]
MRRAKVYMKGIEAGTLTENTNGSYSFEYEPDYFANSSMPEVSLTLPKTEIRYTSDYLFPFFFSLLSEGANKEAQCRLLRIDEKDYFGLLLATATHDTIGAVTVKSIGI